MIRLALERRISTAIACIAFVALGTFSLLRLPVALLPTVERPRFVVDIKSPDRSLDQLTTGLVEPIEQRLAALGSVRSIRSEVRDGAARIIVETDWQTDPDELQIDATRRLESVGDFRPQEMVLRVIGGDPEPTVEVAVSGGSGAERTLFVEKTLVPQLARLSGAGRIELAGLTPARVVIRPRAAALAAQNVTPSQLATAVSRIGQTVGAGRLREGANIRPVVISHEATSLEAIGNLMVSTVAGAAPLSGLASISLEEVPGDSSFRIDGRDAVLVRVYRSPRANAVTLARSIRDDLSTFASRPGSQLKVAIVVDRSVQVVSALRELAIGAFLGILIGTLVLRYMLGRWTPTMSLALVIPASVLSSFAMFHAFGIPLDVVSLAGLTLAGGMLVDNSIVVLESIETARTRGSRNAPLDGTLAIAKAVIASCITTLIVFLPLFYLRGLARAFFAEQAFAIVSCLGASLLFSLTLTPLLARHSSEAVKGASPGLQLYLSLLERLLASPAMAITVGVIVAAAAIAAGVLLPRELIPSSSSNAVRVEYELRRDLSREEAERRGRALERIAVGAGRPRSVYALRGVNPRDAAESEVEVFRGRLELRYDSSAAAKQALGELRKRLNGVAGVRTKVGWAPNAFTELLGEESRNVQVILSASDATRLHGTVARLTKQLNERLGVIVTPERMGGADNAVAIVWDDARLAQLGISRDAVEQETRTALTPRVIGRARISGTETDVMLERIAPSDLGLIPVASVQGRVVPFSALASASLTALSATLVREDQRTSMRLDITAADGGEPDIAALQRELPRLPLLPEESARLAGEALEVKDAFTQLRLAFVLSLILMFLTIAGAYESLVLPPLIMVAVPFAAAGGVVALLITRQSLNMMSFIGLILLGGIVVNHTIVLLDRMEQLRATGVDEDDAVRAAARERYRPILMTTLTTLIGMLPLAIMGGDGVELRRALSITVIGGLVTSTFASLLLIPLLHRAVEPFRRRAGGTVRETGWNTAE